MRGLASEVGHFGKCKKTVQGKKAADAFRLQTSDTITVYA